MKMKRIIQILLILISCVSMAYGQEYLDFNSRYNRQKRVLVVPFDERIYFNDATAEIAKRDGLTHDEIMEYFRYQLNLQLVNSLIDSCEVVDLFKDNTREDEADISGLYTTMSYELRLAEFELDTENMGALARKRAEKLDEARRKQREEEMKNARPGIQNGELVGRKQQTDDMYLHIIIGQPEVLKEIASRRKVDYFLFVNQFDIKTDYRDPYISGQRNVQRLMRVHFSIYNSNGEFVSGNYASTKVPYYEDSKERIVNQYFPEIMRQILKKLKFQ
ncbi:MAG: hypothetical protein II815_07190 [Bacteroidales bacterium]|nr:hypothetical protein [Bacteroidales bacterium]